MLRKVRYMPPVEIDQEHLKKQAGRRRRALAKAGCSTYSLGMRAGLSSIVCLCCGLGSSNPLDVQNRYCGFCDAFHSEWVEED